MTLIFYTKFVPSRILLCLLRPCGVPKVLQFAEGATMPNFHATPGIEPRFGLNTIYRAQNGDIYDATIKVPGTHSEDRKFWNVSVQVIGIEGWPALAQLNYIWQYSLDRGEVFWKPCGPPWGP
jgi:hypothetical protein